MLRSLIRKIRKLGAPKKKQNPNALFYVPDGNHQTRLIQSIQNTPTLAQELITTEYKSDCFLPVYIHPFLLDPACEEALNKDVIEYYRRGLRILLDFSTEALVFTPDDHFFSIRLKALHTFLEQKDIDASKITLLHANTADPKHYVSWCKRHGIRNPLRVISYDFYMYESAHAISQYYEENGLFKKILESSFTQTKHKYIFSCLNLRPKPHRYCVAALLRSLLPAKDILLSFMYKAEASERKKCIALASSLQKAPEILPAIERLEADIPITIDYDNTKTLQDDIYKLPNAKGVWESLLLFKNNSRSLLESSIDIVNETWFTDDSCRFFSEKTLRPLVTLRPFILIGCPFSLQRLRELGYKTFHPMINEEYDSIAAPILRMDALLGEIERLANMSKPELEALYLSLQEILRHNYFHTLRDMRINHSLIKAIAL